MAIATSERYKILENLIETAGKTRTASLAFFLDMQHMELEHVPATNCVLVCCWNQSLQVHDGEERQLDGLQRTSKLCYTALTRSRDQLADSKCWKKDAAEKREYGERRQSS